MRERLLSMLGIAILTVLCRKSRSDFVKLRNDGGHWWLIAPDGSRLLSLGVTAVNYDNSIDGVTGIDEHKQANDLKFHGDRADWARVSVAFLKQHGFNTLGPWSSKDVTQVDAASPEGTWAFANGDEYSIAGATMTLTKGFAVGTTYGLHDVTLTSFKVDSDYGLGSATFTASHMTWKNGHEATRTAATADGLWVFPHGDEYSIAGSTMTIVKGFAAQSQYTLSEISPTAFKLNSEYGSGSATFTDSQMIWANGQTATRKTHKAMLCTPLLDIGASFCNYDIFNCFPDVFSREFIEHTATIVREKVLPVRDDQSVLGWYFDNELMWFMVAGKFLLPYFQSLPPFSPGRLVVDAFVAGSEATGVDLSQKWAQHVSTNYFSTIGKAIRAVDPNHLLLGCKFINMNNEILDPILRGARGNIDVLTFDTYAFTPGEANLDHYHQVSGLPIIIGEAGIRAVDNLSGNLNRAGAGPIVPTQQTRANAMGVFVRKLLVKPYAVGYNFFSWADQPSGGRGGPGGEDSNYGLLSLRGARYDDVIGEMGKIHASASALHERGLAAIKCPLDELDYYSGVDGLLRSSLGDMCLAANADASVSLAPCSKSRNEKTIAQLWHVTRVGGRAGFRLKNTQSQGCLHHLLYGDHFYDVRADGPCESPDLLDIWPFVRFGPSAWEHDDDCSLMQFCTLSEKETWAHSLCRYESSCVSAERDGPAQVRKCEFGAVQQRFAFVAHKRESICEATERTRRNVSLYGEDTEGLESCPKDAIIKDRGVSGDIHKDVTPAGGQERSGLQQRTWSESDLLCQMRARYSQAHDSSSH